MHPPSSPGGPIVTGHSRIITGQGMIARVSVYKGGKLRHTQFYPSSSVLLTYQAINLQQGTRRWARLRHVSLFPASLWSFFPLPRVQPQLCGEQLLERCRPRRFFHRSKPKQGAFAREAGLKLFSLIDAHQQNGRNFAVSSRRA